MPEAVELGSPPAGPLLVVRDARPGRFEELRLRVHERDREPGDSGHVRDSGAHDPAADHDGAGHVGSGARRRRMNVPVAFETSSSSAFLMVVSRYAICRAIRTTSPRTVSWSPAAAGRMVE